MEQNYTLPRLYVKAPLEKGGTVTIEGETVHYLKNVLRVIAGQKVRLFNGESGEFLSVLIQMDKKKATVMVERQLREQTEKKSHVHLIFPPLKKEAQDFLIEKATELGVDFFHPVLTAQSDVRTINDERIRIRIIESSEQSERLNIPVLNNLQQLDRWLSSWPEGIRVYTGVEREERVIPFSKEINERTKSDYGVLIGPAGGWRQDEKELLKRFLFIRPVSLGENILRAETAAVAMLSALRFGKENEDGL